MLVVGAQPDLEPAAGDATTPETEFVALFGSMAAEVRSWIARHGLAEDAEDLCAETFTVVWTRWQDLPADHSRRRAYVYGVALNMIRRARTRRANQAAAQARLYALAPEPSFNIEEEVASAARVRALLSELPPREFEAFSLVVWADLDPREAADALGCSHAALAARLARARRRLRAAARRAGGQPQGGGDVR